MVNVFGPAAAGSRCAAQQQLHSNLATDGQVYVAWVWRFAVAADPAVAKVQREQRQAEWQGGREMQQQQLASQPRMAVEHAW
jgi:hypothetical protein